MTLDRWAQDRPSTSSALRAYLVAAVGVYVLRLLSASLPVVVTLLAEVACFAAPTVVYYVRQPELRPSLRLRGLDPVCALLIALSAFVGMFALNMLSTYWMQWLASLGLRVSTGNDAIPATPAALGAMLLVSALLPALLEEGLFRGFVLPSLERMDPVRAALTSGALFALLHGRLEALPAHLLLGFALGMLVLRTGSLYAAVLFHAVYNGSLLVVAYLAAQAGPVAAATGGAGVGALPATLALLCVWALLLYTAMQRGAKRRKDPLPPAERMPLSRGGRGLLILSFLIALGILGEAVWLMAQATP